ncbi:2OG-Fe(II) oxygenase [Methylocella silvestris BL2]|uniref:2OG-Fe(II) oxygenase n=1 Tax=Methylocella silvestris (strain DSM 15510 / CIP 108128 / LMG 27833 / NCIMB 13906 / BL2) TaxID=395965 RepID=B8ESE9_METSB|nr:alpha-ketoglutarate-dependent dioxygenase AlkB [Methylocella silvestris]ACK49839.1 2OG-Fe(II) oxygenase [Methylocella silvestris BL2]
MLNVQMDLFERSLLPGLRLGENIISAAAEQTLISAIDAARLSPFRFQGWLGKRVTASFGWRYDFETASFGPAEPIPEFLLPLRESAAGFAGLPTGALAQALLIRYDPGAGIGWHRDRPLFEHVIGISLGAPAVLRFRRRTAAGFDRANAPLAPRSIYHLSGDARHLWEHSIAQVDVARWSITFRSLSEKGLVEAKRVGGERR